MILPRINYLNEHKVFHLSCFMAVFQEISLRFSFFPMPLDNNVWYAKIQWNLYKADTISAKKSVHFIEMSAL